MIVWTDLETTGLDPDNNAILEVAVIVTDDHLNEIGLFQSLVHPDYDPSTLKEAGACWEGHRENGLIDELCRLYEECVLPSVYDTERNIFEFLSTALAAGDKKPPLAGSTISFDRGFLAKHMPLVLTKIHYRNIDVSSIRELALRWRPELETPEKKGAHRALDDIRESINLLKFYRKKGFIG